MNYLVEFSNSPYDEEFEAVNDQEAVATAHEFVREYNDFVGFAPATEKLIPSAVYRLDEWGKIESIIY